MSNGAQSPAQRLPMLASPDVVRIYELRTRYGGLRNVPGIEFYADRSLDMLGTAVVNESQHLDPYLEHLRDTNIGAKEVIRASGSGIIMDHLSEEAIERIRERVRGHRDKLEFFHATGLEVEFVRRVLRLKWPRVVWGNTPEQAEVFGNKAELRRMGAELNFVHFFPLHRIHQPDDEEGILNSVNKLLEVKGWVILKPSDGATGDGSHFVGLHHWQEATLAAIDDLRTVGAEEIIVEVAYKQRLEISVQCESDKTGAYITAVTINIVEGTGHIGNLITSGDLPDVPLHLVEEAKRQALFVARIKQRRGERGNSGYDFIFADDTCFMLESNVRVTGATPLLAVALQCQDNGAEHWAAISDTVPAPRGTSFIQAVDALDDAGVLFNGQVGVRPVCVGTLPLGKAMVQSFAPDAVTARLNLASATEALAHAA
jgi:hypothetical protein